MAPLRVLVCDALPLVRDGLHTILDAQQDVEVVDATESGIHAIMLARTRRPDVIVTGLQLVGVSGLELIRRLRAEGLDPEPRVVVLAMSHSDETVTEVLRAGANGLLTEDATREEVVAAIRAAARGQTMLSPTVTERLVDWFRRREVYPHELLRPAVAALTPRERQVLLLVAQGRSTEEVAGELYIGVSTVRTHLHRLRAKLDLKDRAQLVSFAYRSGLMSH
ncbi:DNA-binding response regulator, NarL/FixJ family, contains REC and HTH domains [Thermomonospora echinospora]|uniref:DNA-binding response regulator, NarL/FixJ family, contains REC and HTH domains n=1 Tax=Thermomonospora echinospora TaxID=1992 RepID=A0A1H6DZB1_9ACTN|nr:response regulator transcription factor [Thermomonospora echinospora]SEG90086.1 DNA-binding response regulator, NarL/FixJ family, contains REC and HTH domains [Thermomonospora echinospora]